MLENIGDRVIIEFGTKRLKNDPTKEDASHEGVEKKLDYTIRHIVLNPDNILHSEVSNVAEDIDNFCDALKIVCHEVTGEESLYEEGEYRHFCAFDKNFRDIIKFIHILTFAMDEAANGKLRLVFEKFSKNETKVYFEMPFSKKAYSNIDPFHKHICEKATGQEVGMSKQRLYGLESTILFPHLQHLIKAAEVDEIGTFKKLFAKPFQEAISDVIQYANKFNAYNSLSEEQLKEIRRNLASRGISTKSVDGAEELSLRPALPTRSKGKSPIYISDDCLTASIPTGAAIGLQSSLTLDLYHTDPIISII